MTSRELLSRVDLHSGSDGENGELPECCCVTPVNTAFTFTMQIILALLHYCDTVPGLAINMLSQRGQVDFLPS
jgi:hypothetical protein